MTDENFTLSIDDVVIMAKEILAMEDKNLKRWSKIPQRARGEDLTKIITTHFPDLDDDDITWAALWVDLYVFISLNFKSTEGELVVLLSCEETVETLMGKTEEDLNYFESELEWITNFGCLLTEGSDSDIGAWFFDLIWDRLYEIEAIADFEYLFDDGLAQEELEALPVSKRPFDRAKAANIESTSREVLARLAQDSSSGVRFVVALNPNTPSEALEALTKDECEEVRSAAKENAST